MFPIAQASPFWSAPSGSSQLFISILVAFAVGIGLIFALMALPARYRKNVVFVVGFVAGLFYVARFLWPAPIDRKPGDIPLNFVEGIGFWLADAQGVVTTFTNVLGAFLIGLGVYSLFRVHLRKVMKQQTDWGFSALLLLSLVTMAIFGFWDWGSRQGAQAILYENSENWLWFHKVKDVLFDGLFQQMDAAMFSMIAFYILSAAYRAFRVRSIEATLLLATALVLMLSLMGAVTALIDNRIPADGFVSNFKLASVAGWLQDTLQTSSIRGIDFGVGIGALAMGLRLWLGLEKTSGGSS